MAIKTKSLSKRPNGTWIVTVYDNQDQIGTDEKGNAIYRTYTVIHNPADGAAALKKKLESKIKATKAKIKEEKNFKAIIDDIAKTVSI